jgi:hypothetical protein
MKGGLHGRRRHDPHGLRLARDRDLVGRDVLRSAEERLDEFLAPLLDLPIVAGRSVLDEGKRGGVDRALELELRGARAAVVESGARRHRHRDHRKAEDHGRCAAPIRPEPLEDGHCSPRRR